MQVITAARAAHQIAFVDQTFKHQRSGVARNLKLLRQLPTRWQRRVDGENAAENGVDQRFANLLLQPALVVKIHVQ